MKEAPLGDPKITDHDRKIRQITDHSKPLGAGGAMGGLMKCDATT